MVKTQGEVEAERQRVLAVVRRALRSPDGTQLLELLEERWHGRLPGKTAEQMQANAGAQEVISFLRRLRERKEG